MLPLFFVPLVHLTLTHTHAHSDFIALPAECGLGYQGSRVAVRQGCTVMYPEQKSASCRCLRCPAGSTSGGGYMNETRCSPGETDGEAS
jgi:hypothetical protein